MSKYEPLGAHLNKARNVLVPMSFDEIEKVIGFSLPPVANGNRAWWSNNPSNNVMTKVWLAAGYRSEQVDMAARRLVFRRDNEAPSNQEQDRPNDARPSSSPPLFGWLKGTVRITAGDDLTLPLGDKWGGDLP